VSGTAGWPIRPEQVDELVDRDDLVRVEQQDGQERALLGRPEVREPSVLRDLERPEDAILHHRLMLCSGVAVRKSRNARTDPSGC
jgi:hypothetical protein